VRFEEFVARGETGVFCGCAVKWVSNAESGLFGIAIDSGEMHGKGMRCGMGEDDGRVLTI
jgi:hypothetical protein